MHRENAIRVELLVLRGCFLLGVSVGKKAIEGEIIYVRVGVCLSTNLRQVSLLDRPGLYQLP